MSDPSPEAPTPDAGPGTGLFLIDKPAGPTSHDVVQRLRRWTGIRRVGHGGTLDPMATGLLPIFVGRATRLIEYLGEHPKHYRATVRLGVSTDTDDAEGAVVAEAPVPDLSAAQIEQALGAFRGTIEQVPPAFSAVKVGGVTAHRAARRGDPVEIAPREVTIHALTMGDWRSPLLDLEMTVSTGTYVRAIARDLGAQLGCGGHVIEMRRTGIGPVRVEQAHGPDDLGPPSPPAADGISPRRWPASSSTGRASSPARRSAAGCSTDRPCRCRWAGRGRPRRRTRWRSTGWARRSPCSSPRPAGPSAGGRPRC